MEKLFRIIGILTIVIILGGLIVFLLNQPEEDQTKEILETKDGVDAILAINDLLWDVYFSRPYSLSEEELNFLYVIALEGEVGNGGFDQYFWNSSGDNTYGAVNALEAIGSTCALEQLNSAIAQFPNGYVSSNRGLRQSALDKVREETDLYEIDKKFYACDEDLDALLLDYIRENVEAFR